jgi:gliding motility-associated-like protein
MPNVFTPDGDDKNPVFKPIYYDNIASAEIVIYNRWGQKMITTDLEGWNGNVGNEDAPSGVYYYELRYKDFRGIGYQAKGECAVDSIMLYAMLLATSVTISQQRRSRLVARVVGLSGKITIL